MSTKQNRVLLSPLLTFLKWTIWQRRTWWFLRLWVPGLICVTPEGGSVCIAWHRPRNASSTVQCYLPTLAHVSSSNECSFWFSISSEAFPAPHWYRRWGCEPVGGLNRDYFMFRISWHYLIWPLKSSRERGIGNIDWSMALSGSQAPLSRPSSRTPVSALLCWDKSCRRALLQLDS